MDDRRRGADVCPSRQAQKKQMGRGQSGTWLVVVCHLGRHVVFRACGGWTWRAVRHTCPAVDGSQTGPIDRTPICEVRYCHRRSAPHDGRVSFFREQHGTDLILPHRRVKSWPAKAGAWCRRAEHDRAGYQTQIRQYPAEPHYPRPGTDRKLSSGVGVGLSALPAALGQEPLDQLDRLGLGLDLFFELRFPGGIE